MHILVCFCKSVKKYSEREGGEEDDKTKNEGYNGSGVFGDPEMAIQKEMKMKR